MGQMDGGDGGGGGHPYHYQALLAAVHQQTVPFPNPFPAPSSGTLSLSLYTVFFLTSRNVRAAGRQADHQNSDLFLYLLLLYYTIIKKEQENLEVLVYHLLI
jgi:hypothetical protein